MAITVTPQWKFPTPPPFFSSFSTSRFFLFKDEGKKPEIPQLFKMDTERERKKERKMPRKFYYYKPD